MTGVDLDDMLWTDSTIRAVPVVSDMWLLQLTLHELWRWPTTSPYFLRRMER